MNRMLFKPNVVFFFLPYFIHFTALTMSFYKEMSSKIVISLETASNLAPTQKKPKAVKSIRLNPIQHEARMTKGIINYLYIKIMSIHCPYFFYLDNIRQQ